MKTLKGTLIVIVPIVAVLIFGGGKAQLPEHPHMLVQDFNFGTVDGKLAVVGWRKCIELAANQSLPLKTQHEHVHFGTAGGALFEKAGHAVVPGAPFSPWANCAELEAALPIIIEE